MPNLALTLLEWGLLGFAVLICLIAVAMLVLGRLLSRLMTEADRVAEEDRWR